MDKQIRTSVEEFYSEAAKKPAPELCCPSAYKDVDLSHIPEESREVAYGCGSPVAEAALMPGESVLDLGSGGGIDCFIAARLVGSSGRVIGVDMTDDMLGRARAASEAVAENLGYSNVEFKKGFLEDIPLDDETIGLVVSNCVINLSPDKAKVFGELYRVLSDGGRFCISDVVSEKDVPVEMRTDKTLWGECVSGALTEAELMALAREAGFFGLQVTSRVPYREASGIRFFSITLKGYKLKKGPECVYKGTLAIYNGPFESVLDDEGHEFRSGIAVSVCTDTVKRLRRAPYAGRFTIIEGSEVSIVECAPATPERPGTPGSPRPKDVKKGSTCC